MMTTAELREAARKAERELRWGDAAKFWETAIAVYPNPIGNLAQADIARMKERATSCRGTAATET
jgi:hypothetical protein